MNKALKISGVNQGNAKPAVAGHSKTGGLFIIVSLLCCFYGQPALSAVQTNDFYLSGIKLQKAAGQNSFVQSYGSNPWKIYALPLGDSNSANVWVSFSLNQNKRTDAFKQLLKKKVKEKRAWIYYGASGKTDKLIVESNGYTVRGQIPASSFVNNALSFGFKMYHANNADISNSQTNGGFWSSVELLQNQNTFAKKLQTTFQNDKCTSCHGFQTNAIGQNHRAQGRIPNLATNTISDSANCSACHTAARGYANNWHAAPPSQNFTGMTPTQTVNLITHAPFNNATVMKNHLQNDTLIQWSLGKMGRRAKRNWTKNYTAWINSWGQHGNNKNPE